MHLPSSTIRVIAVGLLVLAVIMAAATGLSLWILSDGQGLHEVSAATLWKAISFGVILWFVLAMGFLFSVWYAERRVARRMQALGQKLSEGGRDPETTIRRVREDVGPVADALRPLASAVKMLSDQGAEARGHVGALLQTNPHYVLLCTMEGDFVEANPAFYAVTGVSPDALQGKPAVLLQEMFPVEPLLGMVKRSKREESAISGIEYALTDRDGVSRPVKVSLRAIRMDGKDAAIIQATDVSKERKLKRRVNDFSDTLDLMVDRRVAQLTSGRSDLEELLEAMGVAVLSFDAGGGTHRFSHAAGRMLGKKPSEVSHFSSFLGCLGLVDSDRAAFTRWFWGTDEVPHVAHVLKPLAGEPVSVQRVVWCRAQGKESGTADHRILLGFQVPDHVKKTVSGDGQQSAQPVASRAGTEILMSEMKQS